MRDDAICFGPSGTRTIKLYGDSEGGDQIRCYLSYHLSMVSLYLDILDAQETLTKSVTRIRSGESSGIGSWADVKYAAIAHPTDATLANVSKKNT